MKKNILLSPASAFAFMAKALRNSSLLIVLITAGYFAEAQSIITTIAGNGTLGYSGDGGVATAAQFDGPSGIVLDGTGNMYVSDKGNHRIRKISAAGVITTIAGSGTVGYSGDGSAATAADINYPHGIAIDANGALYIADYFNHRIRKVDTSGIITTVAGNGTAAYGGDGGAATAANLNQPCGVALDSSGNLYIADRSNHRVRKVDTSGVISTFAGDGIAGFLGDGLPSTYGELNYPSGVAIDGSGNLYIADQQNNRIRKVDTAGIITTLAGNGTSGFSGNGVAATTAALHGPFGVSADRAGNLYISDDNNNMVRKVSPTGIINTIAGDGTLGFGGDGGPATAAQLNNPWGVTTDTGGNIYTTDYANNRVRKITAAVTTTTTYIRNLPNTSGTVVYPNPINDVLYIDNIHSATTYRVTNLIGATILQGDAQSGRNTVSLQSLTPGLYFVELTDADGNRMVKKVVKE